jgi:hypothetical protein
VGFARLVKRQKVDDRAENHCAPVQQILKKKARRKSAEKLRALSFGVKRLSSGRDAICLRKFMEPD